MSVRWPRFSVRNLLLFVTLLCVLASLRTYRIQRYSQAIDVLRGLGGQVDDSPVTLSSWLAGIPPVRRLTFLGPKVGDESIVVILSATDVLDLDGITFTETRISNHGEQCLRDQLCGVELDFVTPVLSPRNF